MKFRRSSLVLAVLLSLGVCANAWADVTTNGAIRIGEGFKDGGSGAVDWGTDSIAIGKNDGSQETIAYGTSCIAIGIGAEAGVSTDLDIKQAIAIGLKTKAAGQSSNAIGYSAQASGGYSNAIGYQAVASGSDSVALGSGSQAGGSDSVALGKNSVVLDSQGNVVSVGNATTQRRIVNVAAAEDVNEALTLKNFDYTNSKGITKLTIDGTDYNIAGVTVDNSFIKDSENAVQSKVVQAEFDKVNTAIAQNKTDIADNKAAIAQNKTDIATNKTAIAQNAVDIATNKSDIAKNKADIAKKADQADLNKETSERIAADTDLQNQINNIGGNLVEDVDRLRSDVKSVGAMAAAMAGLHPRFTGDGKGEFAAAVGTYEGKKATAIGAFYAPDERFMFSLGGAFAAGGKNMANLGVNIALDPRPRLRAGNAYSKAEVDAMLAENNAKFERALAEKDAKYNELLARLEVLESKK